MAKKQIIYNIGFNVNNANLKTVQDELNKISKMTLKDIKIIDKEKAKSELNSIKESAEQLGRALEASYNPKIDSINIQKFNQSLKESGTDLNKVATNLQKVDDGGVQSFRNLTAELLTTKKEIKQTSKLLDSMATTFFNTVKWSISSSALNAFTGTIQKAWSYSQKLDESLNDIRIVTGKSNEEMEKFAKNANRVAKELKAGTTNFTNAALIYYQQGLGEEDVQARANVTVKAANVTGQSASEVSEQLTAVWNGYKVVAEEAELYVDKLAAVAATTAADLEELSTGMSKVASAANAMGVDVDQLSAQLATIVSVTRQDASVVGTALKTIYSRMGDLQVDGVDEFGTSLGDVSGKLKQMGIDVLDQEGNLRDMGNVIEEVAAKWGTWTDAQQQAAAVAIAGKRQYNNLIALFENWDMYESAKGTSQTSAGTLQKQQDIYADSLAAKLKNISTAAERVYDALFDSESMKDMLDTVAELIDKFGSFTEAIGGGGNLLGMLGSLGMRVFNEQITKGIFNTISNLGIMKANIDENINRLKIVDQYKDLLKDPEGKDKATIDKMVKIREQELKLSKYLSEEEKKQLEFNIKMTAEIANQRDEEKAKFDEAEAFYKKQFNGMAIGGPEAERNSSNRVTRKSAATDLRDIASTLVNDDTEEFENLYKQAKGAKGVKAKDLSGMKKRVELLTEKKGSKDKTNKINDEEKKELVSLEKKIKAKEAELELNRKLKELKSKDSKLDEATKTKLINLSKDKKLTEEKLLELLKESADYYDLQAHNIEKNADNVQKLDQNEKDLEKTNKKIFDAQKIKIYTSEIINLTSSIAAVANGIKILSNISNIATDSSLTAVERIDQTIQAVTSGIATMAPGVISSINAIKVAGEDAGSKIQRSFGWISLILMAVTAVISGIAEIYKSMDHRTELEKAQDNFNAISETAKQTKDRLAELRKEYNGLMSDISKYRDAKTAIEEMRVGTEEWQNAVEELNQQVEDLLIKYPELKENLTKDKDGVYQIDEDIVSQVAKKQKENIKKQELLVAGTDLMAAASNENVKKREAEDRLQNIVSSSYTPGDPEGYFSYDNSIYTAIGVSSVKDLGSEASKAEYDKNKNAIESIFGEYGEIDSETYTGWDTFKIDVDKLTKASEEQLKTLKDNISKNEDLSGEQKRIYAEYIDAIKQNKNSLDAASEQTQALKEAYLTQFADKNEIDSEVFNNLAKAKKVTIDTSNVKASVTDYIENEWDGDNLQWEDYSVNIGKVIDKTAISNDIAEVTGWINAVLKSTYGDNIQSATLNTDQLAGINLADLGNHTIEVNGEKMTINTLLAKYKSQQLEKNVEIKTEDITEEQKELQSKGRLQEAAYYNHNLVSSRTSESIEWDATIEKLDEIIGYGDEYKTYANNARTGLQYSIREIMTGSKRGVLDNLSAYSKLTETQVQHLKNSIDASELAGAGDTIQTLVNSITDPQQMAELQALLDKVDWTNADSVNQFRAGLMEAGIEIADLDGTWANFIQGVNSGMKQWISNSKKVGENLAYIRDTVEGIEMGSLISDEEYKKMVQINPEVAKYFVKTAGGMIAIANGKEIADVLKTQYSDLGGIKDYFEAITTAVGTTKGDAYLKNEDVNTQEGVLDYIGTGEKQTNFVNTAVALKLGNEDRIKELISKASTGDAGAIELLKDMIMSVNQARLDVENGEYSSSAAQQVYGTSVAGSWTKANEGVGGNWEGDAENKVQSYWKTTYLSELGLNLKKELIDSFDIGQLENAAIAFRKLELDYFKQYENELNKINVLSERVFGEQKQAYLNQVVAQEKDSAETAREIAVGSRNAFETIINKSGFNGYYDSDGKLNYTALYDAIANGTVDQETANSIIDQYNKVIDAEQKAVESADKVIDAQIAAFKYAYEVQDQINQSLRAWRDFQRDWKSSLSEFGESELTKNVQGALDILNDEATDFGANLYKLEMYSNIGSGVNTVNPYYDSTSGTFNQEQFRADWQAEIEDAQQSLEKMQGALQTMYESYLSAQDELLEIYDKEINKLQKVNSILKSSADLAKMMGLSTASYYENIVDSNLKSYNLALGQLDVMQDEYDKIFNQDGTRKADFSKEMGDKVIENLATAGENVLAKGQELYTAISDQFANKLQAMFDEYSGIAGLSLSNASEDWSMGLAKENRYLDEVNEAYARSQLNRDFQKVIDETDSVSAKNRLLEKQMAIETKLTAIKEAQGKLSQADLDRANAEFELELKKIALEEAQQTANKMKLTRDANGNYSYQYVSDQDAIAKAEEELAAAENNLYNMDKDRTQSLVSEYYSTMIEAQQKIAEAQAAGNMERVERYKEYYFGENGLISGIQKELGFAADNLDAMGTSLMGSNWTSSFENLKNLTTELSESGLAKLVGNGDGSLTSLITTTSTSMDTLKGSLETLLGENGALSTLPNKITASIDEATINTNVAELSNLTDDIIKELPGLVTAVDDLKTQWNSAISSYKDYVNRNTDGLTDNTTAVNGLTDSVKTLNNKLSGEIVVTTQSGQFAEISFDGALNDTGNQ